MNVKEFPSIFEKHGKETVQDWIASPVTVELITTLSAAREQLKDGLMEEALDSNSDSLAVLKFTSMYEAIGRVLTFFAGAQSYANRRN